MKRGKYNIMAGIWVFLGVLVLGHSVSSLELAGPSVQAAKLGSDALVPCLFTVDNPPVDPEHLTVFWLFRDKGILSYDKTVRTTSSRYSLSTEALRIGIAHLTISNIQIYDGGRYKCSVIYRSERKEKEIRLDIGAPPQVTVTGNTVVMNKESVLRCSITGFYPVDIDIRWFRDGERLEDNIIVGDPWRNPDRTYNMNSSVTIRPTEEDRERNFSCRVRHKYLQEPLHEDFHLVYEEAALAGIIAACCVIGLLLIIIIAGALWWKKRRKGNGPFIVGDIEGPPKLIDGEEATLHCTVDNYPDNLRVTWLIRRAGQDQEIQTSQMRGQSEEAESLLDTSYVIKSHQEGRQYISSLSFIPHIERHKDVTFICRGDSKQHNAEKTFHCKTIYEETKPFEHVLVELGLEKFRSSKLTLRNVLSIGPENPKLVQPKTKADLPEHFLVNILAFNRNARTTELVNDLGNSGSGVDDDPFDLFNSKTENHRSKSISPLDVLCAVLNCSDQCLQQEIISKMSMCQFAVPLLLPTGDGSGCTFMLWAMRDIVKKWRPHSLADSKGFREDNVVNIEMPIFSFVRLGPNKLCKSKILNQILNPDQQHHDFFIHDNMKGGNIERKISNGLVEMSLYFPCGKSDVFSDPIAVANLRGDLESNQEQFTFLTRISSATFIFMENMCDRQFRILSSCLPSDTKFYFIVTPGPGKIVSSETKEHMQNLIPLLQIEKTNFVVKSSTMNDAGFINKIKKIIDSQVKNDPKLVKLKNITEQVSKLNINIDEDSPELQKTRDRALTITSMIKDVEMFKNQNLTLQGDLWKQLSKLDKEFCRMIKQGGEDQEKYPSKLIEERDSLLRKQYDHDLPEAMILFITAITHLSKDEKQHFLKWMKFDLDSIVRKNVSKLWTEYIEKSRKSYASDDPQKLYKRISESSLGIEHFLRELGQIYEAERFMIKQRLLPADRIQFAGLPKTAADLLLDGFPLELIDGDASNILLQWITDVLTELDKKSGGQCRIRVISVLGVQSTGKSTLLNTMFGLQFPVASGRCTRGAFMTLIKVKENFQEEMGCEFILVIDTEGLRAPELGSLDDSYKHDNELATLVVGLSDITIVNMVMEYTSEMKDILQIVVHAFLRMKKVGKRPNCQFVHQNVSDVSAHDKNLKDRKKLLEQLDEMTKVAAKMEKRSDIKKFSHVMDYDLDKHNWYIPGLWQGVPPMAPVNSGYTEHVSDLKNYLLQFLKTQKLLGKASTIPDFCEWVRSLWTAVKHEKFIFSFRNSLVAEAYNKLSMKFSLWEWNFTKKIHEWGVRKETNIKNQATLNLDENTFETYKDLDQLLNDEEKKMLDLIEKYFEDESENINLIERYREDFVKSVTSLRKELRRNAIDKYEKTLSIQKGNLKIQDIKKKYQAIIEEKINGLLKTSREKNNELSNTEVEAEFNAMWEKALSDLHIEKLKRCNVSKAILRQLREDMSSKGPDINQQLLAVKNLAEPCTNFTIAESHLDQDWTLKLWKQMSGKSNNSDEKLRDFASSLIEICDRYVTEKVNTSENYDDTYCQEILQMINTKLEDEPSKCLHFTLQFELDIKLFIFGEASKRFQQMHDSFIKANDIRTFMENLKPEYWTIFSKQKMNLKTEASSSVKSA